MTSVQVEMLLEQYILEIDKHTGGLGPKPANYDIRQPLRLMALRHALHMCNEIKRLLEDEQHMKAHRWLGFLQGVLWMTGVYSINDMRKHNKS